MKRKIKQENIELIDLGRSEDHYVTFNDKTQARVTQLKKITDEKGIVSLQVSFIPSKAIREKYDFANLGSKEYNFKHDTITKTYELNEDIVILNQDIYRMRLLVMVDVNNKSIPHSQSFLAAIFNDGRHSFVDLKKVPKKITKVKK